MAVCAAGTASSIAYNVLNKHTTAAAVCHRHVDLIIEHDGSVLAFESLNASACDHAAFIDQIQHHDTELRLAGVPIAVKSAFSTVKMPTTWGTPIHEDQMLPYDADVVNALASAGAIIVGKTALTEYCAAAAPATLNPCDPRRTPGGSSSGSAASVAAGMVPVALGSQTMGSVIRPAAYCGVYGFKPSFGIVSRGGLQRVSAELDTVGWFTNTPEDAHLILSTAMRHQYGSNSAPAVPSKVASPTPWNRHDTDGYSHAYHRYLLQRQYPISDARCRCPDGTHVSVSTQHAEEAAEPSSARSKPHTHWTFLRCQSAEDHLRRTDHTPCPIRHHPTSPAGNTLQPQPQLEARRRPLQGARVASVRCACCAAHASSEALGVMEDAERELERLGAEIRTVNVPEELQDHFEITQVLMSHGLATAHSDDYHTHAARMSPQLQALFLQGLAVTPEALSNARAAQHSTRRFFQTLLQPPSTPPSTRAPACPSQASTDPAGGSREADHAATVRDSSLCQAGLAYSSSSGGNHFALSLPALGVAPLRTEATGSARPASLWSLCGLPALSMPWGISTEGLPLAVQLSAAHGCDQELLLTAAVVHSARQQQSR